MLNGMLDGVLGGVLGGMDWIFRPQCAACGAPASPLCPACSASLVELGPACPRCAEPTGEHAVTCRRCAVDPLPLDRVVAPWRFGGQLASAIRRLKFAGRPHIARDVAPLWAPVLAAAVAEHDAIVVPVPLHWRRRWTRGYDHAWLLARHACALAGSATRRRRASCRRPRARATYRARLPPSQPVRSPGARSCWSTT
jgi:predicted amidophosphoribosyltransferase